MVNLWDLVPVISGWGHAMGAAMTDAEKKNCEMRNNISSGAKWLQGPHRLYLVPQNLPPFQTPPPDWISYDSSIGDDFDAVIYIDQTHPSTPL